MLRHQDDGCPEQGTMAEPRTLYACLRHSCGSPVTGMPATMSCRENICARVATA